MGIKSICLDIGNTLIKYGVFEETDLITSGQVGSLEKIMPVLALYKVQDAIISSVRKQEKFTLPVSGKCIWLSHETAVPVQNSYTTPHTLGMDRLSGVVGASFLFPDKDCLVIDAGTCIKLDFINRYSRYEGGSISPGLAMKYKALHTFTGKLPLVEEVENLVTPLIGKSTLDCLKSGVLNGTLAEVTGLIAEYKQQWPELVVVLCGGDAPFFEKNLKERIFVLPDLVLIGLNRILKYNV